jgi:hypothetical protein
MSSETFLKHVHMTGVQNMFNYEHTLCLEKWRATLVNKALLALGSFLHDIIKDWSN